ncbi:hypothetical protein AB834_03235 [PVC group bacterium (ex Bugula neritina AB1)]|nr:hypothetical protein AB834_03235 [PVC group bacterium (ex Bugula neritina AB1)]
MVELIKKIIQQGLPDAKVKVLDPYNDGQHFEAIVASDTFKNISLIKQHQKVMNLLKNDFDSATIHALKLKTLTVEEYEETSNSE